MADWESKFRDWAKPPSESEQAKCEKTVAMIREAVAQDSALQSRNIHVFVQGSYRNNTNVRRDSDVDVGVLCYDTFFYDTPPDTTSASLGITPSTYEYSTFKSELGRALVSYFGADSVTRGNKAFDIKSSRAQVEADVSAFFEHRRYGIGQNYLSGVELRPDNRIPSRIINWPTQHYDNGVAKNNRTGRRYKGLARILKSLRNEMKDAGNIYCDPIIGFLNECLAFNVPDSEMASDKYAQMVRDSLHYLFIKTTSEADCGEWGEVSELKYLFRGPQRWTRVDANQFVLAAWNYVGYR